MVSWLEDLSFPFFSVEDYVFWELSLEGAFWLLSFALLFEETAMVVDSIAISDICLATLLSWSATDSNPQPPRHSAKIKIPIEHRDVTCLKILENIYFFFLAIRAANPAAIPPLTAAIGNGIPVLGDVDVEEVAAAVVVEVVAAALSSVSI